MQLKSGKFSKTSLAASIATIIIVSAGTATTANAKKYRGDHRVGHNSVFDYARVIDAQPVYETYQVSQPVENCWQERVPTRYDSHHYQRKHNSATPEILGAIIGAAVGNQFGGGRGKKVATAAGAILGGSIGHDLETKSHQNSRYANRGRHGRAYETVERCEIKDEYRSEQRMVGYDVSYKYRGNVFHTHMDRDPGDKIKVRVSVDPV